jgi:hypothetical protein
MTTVAVETNPSQAEGAERGLVEFARPSSAMALSTVFVRERGLDQGFAR